MVKGPVSQKINQKKKLASTDSFLEALRNLGGGIFDSAVNDIVKGIPREAINQFIDKKSGELKPGEELDFKKLTNEERIEIPPASFYQDFLDIRRQERIIWRQEEEKVRLQIAAILEELKKLASATQNLAKETKVASEQAPVNPGEYHISFFEKLRQTLILIRKRVESSATWLAAFNQRVKRRNYYWAQVRKSGTKFMLSQERYIQTQVG
jgi:hypothetical protein